MTYRLVHQKGTKLLEMLRKARRSTLRQTCLGRRGSGRGSSREAMSTLKSIWETRHPRSRQDEEEILREMQEVLTSPQFCNSKRYPAQECRVA